MQTIAQQNIDLSQEQSDVLEQIESSSKHFFITGKAGTGKSTLLHHLKTGSEKKLVVVAATGVAALNIGGQTIHSLFKIPPKFTNPDEIKVSKSSKKFLSKIETVIIDEVSMVRADLMDAIDIILRQAHDNDEAFGGMQVIMFGDLYQLPPIISERELREYFNEHYSGHYFFNAHVWQRTNFKTIELEHIFRQEDEEFKEILNGIRRRDFDQTLLNQLNERASTQAPHEGIITLALTNRKVSDINHRKLAELPGQSYKYKATIEGKLEPSAFPTEDKLELKVGAQVMFLRNDREKRWVNGSIGTIDYLSHDSIEVNLDGEIVQVKQGKWEKIQYKYDESSMTIKEEVVSSFKQFPLKLAWAITVHKSQGQTLEQVVLDAENGAFAHGQIYVALSRCKSLDGLYLKRPLRGRDIIVDPKISEFFNN